MTTSASTYTLGVMNTIEARELVYFTTVADTLHFGAAADSLGISQPSLSRSIARLERRLGFPLFHRTTRRISLTPAGELFLEDCRRLLTEMDGAIRRAQRLGKSGSLTLAVRPGAGQSALTGLLNSYADLPGSAPVDVLYCYDEVAALHTGPAVLAMNRIRRADDRAPRGLQRLHHPAVLAEVARVQSFRGVEPGGPDTARADRQVLKPYPGIEFAGQDGVPDGQ